MPVNQNKAGIQAGRAGRAISDLHPSTLMQNSLWGAMMVKQDWKQDK